MDNPTSGHHHFLAKSSDYNNSGIVLPAFAFISDCGKRDIDYAAVSSNTGDVASVDDSMIDRFNRLV